MVQPNTFLAKANNRFIATVAMISTFFMTHPLCAQAQGLKNAKDALDKFRAELNTIIPVAAAIILLGLAIGYAGRYIEKGTFVRWAIGVVIAGSAVELAKLLFEGK
ncbi:hypothetical protein ABID23_000244 [Bartonella silvatica]|uniref:Uncharacterized protein n=1 Tax=Bartonella silvatica TaxID=357760 RepID=A0ABV2HF61_9HYPH